MLLPQRCSRLAAVVPNDVRWLTGGGSKDGVRVSDGSLVHLMVLGGSLVHLMVLGGSPVVVQLVVMDRHSVQSTAVVATPDPAHY